MEKGCVEMPPKPAPSGVEEAVRRAQLARFSFCHKYGPLDARRWRPYT